MINPEAPSKRNAQLPLAVFYPEAFAMLTGSNSRSGLAARRLEIAACDFPRAYLGRLSENNLPQSTGGMLGVNLWRF